MAKFVFVTGGVVSGLGKGITAASLGRLLKARGYKVTLQKIDPYFNVDSSNLSPYQHGEIFVTEDGSEMDLVVGHYERMIDENLGEANDVTSGKIYSSVIAKEREGKYEGRTVQVVPHITDEIKSTIKALDDGCSDIIITEIGGTAGDIECHPFLEAIRQMQTEVGRNNVAYIHVTLVPYIKMSGEQKTKPTQHSVKELQNVGIQPDVIVCRSEYAIEDGSKKKLALFCNVNRDCIIQNLTAENIYEIPLKLEEEGLAKVVLRKLKLDDRDPDLSQWQEFCAKADSLKTNPDMLKIGIVGKYTKLHDAYVSLTEAVSYSCIANNKGVEFVWIASEEVNSVNAAGVLKGLSGIIIPAGFGERGFDGKVAAAEFARVNNVPALMIGFGAQAGVVEFARNVCGIKNATSAEFKPKSEFAVIRKLGQKNDFKKGSHVTTLKKGTAASKIYNSLSIVERHRHKYEINPKFTSKLKKCGLVFSGFAGDSDVPEIFELPEHKFYIGAAFRPEFKARPYKTSALIDAFISACSD